MSPEALEREIELNTSKYQLLPFLREKAKVLPIPYEPEELEYSIALELLAYMLFYKRTSPAVLVGLLWNRFKNTELVLEVLDKLIQLDLLDYNTQLKQVITVYSLNPEEMEHFSKMMYPKPLVVKPEKLLRNSDTGYWYNSKGCVILRSHFMKEDVNLDHLNRVNSIPLRINKEVLENRENKPKKILPTVQDRENWNRFTRQQREIAEEYSDKDFYLTHKYDKRGRVYCQGYHLTYQGNDFSNALIEFSHGKKCI